jgi:hypothetical protein
VNKLAVVDGCDSCPNVWWYLGVDPCCLLMDKRPCNSDNNIELWCPLPNAPTEELGAQPLQQTTAKVSRKPKLPKR